MLDDVIAWLNEPAENTPFLACMVAVLTLTAYHIAVELLRGARFLYRKFKAWRERRREYEREAGPRCTFAEDALEVLARVKFEHDIGASAEFNALKERVEQLEVQSEIDDKSIIEQGRRIEKLEALVSQGVMLIEANKPSHVAAWKGSAVASTIVAGLKTVKDRSWSEMSEMNHIVASYAPQTKNHDCLNAVEPNKPRDVYGRFLEGKCAAWHPDCKLRAIVSEKFMEELPAGLAKLYGVPVRVDPNLPGFQCYFVDDDPPAGSPVPYKPR